MDVGMDITIVKQIVKYVQKIVLDVLMSAFVPFVLQDTLEPIVRRHALRDAKINFVIKIPVTARQDVSEDFTTMTIAQTAEKHVSAVLLHITVPNVRQATGDQNVSTIVQAPVTDVLC